MIQELEDFNLEMYTLKGKGTYEIRLKQIKWVILPWVGNSFILQLNKLVTTRLTYCTLTESVLVP